MDFRAQGIADQIGREIIIAILVVAVIAFVVGVVLAFAVGAWAFA